MIDIIPINKIRERPRSIHSPSFRRFYRMYFVQMMAFSPFARMYTFYLYETRVAPRPTGMGVRKAQPKMKSSSPASIGIRIVDEYVRWIFTTFCPIIKQVVFVWCDKIWPASIFCARPKSRADIRHFFTINEHTA